MTSREGRGLGVELYLMGVLKPRTDTSMDVNYQCDMAAARADV